MLRKVHWWLRWLAAMVIVSAMSPGLAQQPPPEYDHKSKYLYLFCSFVDWPKPAKAEDKALVIGVVGPDPFGKFLDRFDGASVNGKKIVIRRFKTTDAYERAQLLFVAKDVDLAAVATKTKNSPVLLVSDQPGWAEKGSMINLYLDDENKVKFEINHDAAKRVGLNLRANLLKLAKIVKDAPE